MKDCEIEYLIEKGKPIIAQYLLDHESDIADGTNDFGDLRPVFIEIFHREPDGGL